MYSDLYLKSRRSKPLMILAAGVVVVFAAFLYSSQAVNLPSRAVAKSLKKHEVANVSSSQASVIWITEEEETGWIVYGTSSDDTATTASDTRDLGGKRTARRIHFVTLSDLKPGTEYYYKIISNNEIIKAGESDTFGFSTPPGDPPSSSVKPAYGTVIDAGGNGAEGALVLYKLQDAYPLATLTKLSGEWLIPLQHAVNRSSHSYFSVHETDKAEIEITDGTSLLSTITALVRLTNPLPQTLILGKNYSFMKDDNVLPASTEPAADPEKDYPISIILPKDNAVIPATRPVLKGEARPGAPVEISVDSEPGYIARIKADSSGGWFVDVPVSFPAGTYKMTVETPDAGGETVRLSRSFQITKSGEQVLGDATPSGTITPTASPSAEPTASPSATITLSPTVTIPIATATPVATMSPSILPTSGAFDVNPMLWGSISMVVLGAGVLFVF